MASAGDQRHSATVPGRCGTVVAFSSTGRPGGAYGTTVC